MGVSVGGGRSVVDMCIHELCLRTGDSICRRNNTIIVDWDPSPPDPHGFPPLTCISPLARATGHGRLLHVGDAIRAAAVALHALARAFRH